jgi:ketosteroid isomerase-like protein
MTVTTGAAFDLETLQRGYQEWDIEALLSLYADDVEQIQIDREHPPGSPRVRRGKDVYRGMFEHCAAAGVKATVEHAVRNADRASATVTCEFPGGRRVVANTTLELRDGRIVREHTVASGDARATPSIRESEGQR